MTTRNAGIDTANVALHLVTNSIAADRSTLADLTASIEHLGSAPKSTLVEAIAYLAAQVTAYRDASDEDARMFVAQVAMMVERFEERKAAIKKVAAVAV